MASKRCLEGPRSLVSAISRKRAASERRNCGVIQNSSKRGMIVYDAANLALPPGQSLSFPACRHATMTGGVHPSLESIRHVVGMRKSRRLRRLGCGIASLSAAADEVDMVVRSE